MTTIGVTPIHKERTLPMYIPSYNYHYPCFSRVRLAAVKEGIYHPSLPTFRKMDMDEANFKLPDEHSRTSTTCGPSDFNRATSTVLVPPSRKLHSSSVTELGKRLHRYYTTPEELNNANLEWNEFLNRCPERYNIRLPELPENKDLHFTGYAIRYLRPEITSSWRYTLRQEPTLDQYGQKPVPANIYARYRDTNPRYSRNVGSEAWR